MYIVIFGIVFIVTILLFILFFNKRTNISSELQRRMDGRTVVVTGGTSGDGLLIATEIARRGARVILASPYREEGSIAQRKIIRDTQNVNVVFRRLDLASMRSVRTFVAETFKTEDRLDILINNASNGPHKDFLTSDCMSYIMQVNYFGTFLLTLLLLPLLKKSGKLGEHSRIVNISSVLHLIGNVSINHLNSINNWFQTQTYANSKLCLLLFSMELSKKLQGTNVVINNVDPETTVHVYDSLNDVLRGALTVLSHSFFNSPKGIDTTLHVALYTKAGDVSGAYFKNCQVSQSAKSASCEETAKKLWKESTKLMKLTDEELEKCL